jgi:hypothetical protein
MSDDAATKAAIKSIEDLTAMALKALGFGSTHNDNVDHAPLNELPAIQISADGVMNGDGVHSVPTQKRGQLAKVCNGKVVGVVWHYTDTGAAPGSAQKLAERLAQPGGRQASWHVLIGRDGSIWQSVPLTMGSWHAGSSTAKPFALISGSWGLSPGNGLGANSLFAGIELECVGEVRKTATGWRGWPFGKIVPSEGPGVLVPDADVIEAKDPAGVVRHWQGYTKAQENAAERIVRALEGWADVKMESCRFSHQMIDPDRRTDPGPVWMDQVLPRVLGRVFW